MTPTKFQKSIVTSILKGECKDIDTFFVKFCDFTEATNTKGEFIGPFFDFAQNLKVYIPKDESMVLNQLKEFISLWDKLDKLGLIYTSPTPPKNKRVFPIFSSNFEPNQKFLSIIKDFVEKEIVPLPDLDDFVTRGYLTSEEFFMLEENKDRKRAHRLTLIIAAVSIAATLGSVIFQYVTYRTDRTVYIKNAGAFSDTTRVLILNPSAKIMDSTHRSPERAIGRGPR